MLDEPLPNHAQPPGSGDWVLDVLLARDGRETCLSFDRPVTVAQLRTQVAERAADLTAAGLRPGGTVSLRLPPGLAYVTHLLAAWRIGAQVSLLDHRLTTYEVTAALTRIAPQFVVSAPVRPGRVPRGYVDTTAVIDRYPGRPAASAHVLLQLSSGSTGTAKVIGRTSANLSAELDRYRRIDHTPAAGERIVLLASMVHVLGLVGGLLLGLHVGAHLVLPEFLTADGIGAAVAAGTEPTTLLGVPFHLQLLLAADGPLQVPQLRQVTVAGELVRPQLGQAFADRCPVPLGTMYGMTEAGVIATDLAGRHRPALVPAPGMGLREESGQLLLALPDNPYLGAVRPGSWADGWLRTGDAGTVDPASGLVTVHGRLDSQVSVGGLKVDLTEVEQELAGLAGVVEAVVVHDTAVEAFVVLEPGAGAADLHAALAQRLAAYKLPRRLRVLPRLPRTSSGKLVRNSAALRAAAQVTPTPTAQAPVAQTPTVQAPVAQAPVAGPAARPPVVEPVTADTTTTG